jgi:hypothetical protein
MAFNGSEGTFIDLNEGAGLTKSYRNNHRNKKIAQFFGKDKLLELLNQTDAVGIRIYFGERDGDIELVLVASDKNENDIIGKILDLGLNCPTNCSSRNALNA